MPRMRRHYNKNAPAVPILLPPDLGGRTGVLQRQQADHSQGKIVSGMDKYGHGRAVLLPDQPQYNANHKHHQRDRCKPILHVGRCKEQSRKAEAKYRLERPAEQQFLAQPRGQHLERLAGEARARGLNYLYNVVRPSHPEGDAVRRWAAERAPDVQVVLVSESGASVYSASEIARDRQ